MGGGRDVSASRFEQGTTAVVSGERIDPAKLSEVNVTTYGRGGIVQGDRRTDTSNLYLANVEITGGEQSMAVPGSKPLAPKLETVVDHIEKACNGGTGIGTLTDPLWRALAPLTKGEYDQVNERFAHKYGVKYASRGQTWDVQSELKDELGAADLTRFNRMIADKSINDVPPAFRTSGESLLKPGHDLKVGEIKNITLADGREYGVYIPRNADSRAPVIVGMCGSGFGNMKGAMAAETGLTAEAEKSGSIVVFAYPKERMGIASWNVPDRSNFFKTASYDDRNYVDDILKDLGNRSKTSDKVGLMGFADGARFAEAYAADRPDHVAGIVAMSGAWMEGDRKPTKALPVMIVHGNADTVLPYGGWPLVATANRMLETNFDKAKPYLQAKVWSEAGGGDGQIKERKVTGDVVERTYGAGSVEVKEYIVKGGQNAVHDYKNQGSWVFQKMFGKPDLRQDFVTQGTGFLKKHIVRDISGK